jgi:hypothetical protein
MKRKNYVLWMLLAAVGISPHATLAQMPPQSAKLVILSEPVGATVTVNHQTMHSKTNATIVVSPGTYVISVAAGALVCPEITLVVSAGETLTRTCTSTGWK